MPSLAKKSDPQAQRLLVLNKALATACIEGPVENVIALLEQGADPNAETDNHGTLLVNACDRGHVDIVEKLLQHGANVNARVDLGKSYPKWSSDYRDRNYGNALQTACAEGYHSEEKDCEIVQLLLEAGADPNIDCGYYGTALMAVCVEERLEIAQKLLAYNADVNVQVDEKKTGFFYHGEYEGREYGTALQAACAKGNVEIVTELLAKNPNIWVEGGTHGSAINAACSSKNNEILQLLFDHDAAHPEHRASKTDKLSESAAVPEDMEALSLDE